MQRQVREVLDEWEGRKGHAWHIDNLPRPKEWSVVRLFSTLIAVVSAQYWTATLMSDSHLRHLCWYTKFTGAAACASDEARNEET